MSDDFQIPPAVPLSGIISPRPVLLSPIRLNPVLWDGPKEARDQLLDKLIAEEAEQYAEGRIHRNIREQRHE